MLNLDKNLKDHDKEQREESQIQDEKIFEIQMGANLNSAKNLWTSERKGDLQMARCYQQTSNHLKYTLFQLKNSIIPSLPPGRSNLTDLDLSLNDSCSQNIDHLKIQVKSKKINKIAKVKSFKKGTENKSKSRRVTSRSAKINYFKITVKKPSNFLRAKLKSLGFDFRKLEGEDDKRGSRIYLNILLLESKNLLGNEFRHFMNSYEKHLEREIIRYQIKQKEFGYTQLNQCYIIDFNRAKRSTSEFIKGNYIRSIKEYFGTQKEKFYLQSSTIYFTEWKEKIGDSTSMIQMGEENIFDVVEFDHNNRP